MRFSCYDARTNKPLGCLNAETKSQAQRRAFHRWWRRGVAFHVNAIPYREDQGSLRKRARR